MSEPAPILIVDDSRAIRSVVKVTLRSLGRQTIELSNGSEALDYVGKNPVALVVADINMPVMDGVTFVKTVRASDSDAIRALPIVLLSGEKDREPAGLAAGASAFIAKGDLKGSAGLLEVVQRLLG